MRDKKLISVIAPCYNEEENILALYERVKRVFGKLKKYEWELIYVDNDSQDQSQAIFEKLAKKDKKVKALFMSRNFRSPQPSFLAGLEHAAGDAVVLVQGDIQDPPEMIPEFIERWEEGYQVVYGVREKREGYGLLMRLAYKSFYFLMQKLSYISVPREAGDFSLLDREVVDHMLRFPEFDYYVRFLRAYVGFKQIGVPYVREARKGGKSTESFLSGFWWAKAMIVNFSFRPLELISQMAFVVMIFTLGLFIYNIAVFILNPDSPRGIPTIIFITLFLGSVQLLSLSVIAEYLARIFWEVKKRPRYIVRKKLN